jgi:hypothetical protein
MDILDIKVLSGHNKSSLSSDIIQSVVALSNLVLSKTVLYKISLLKTVYSIGMLKETDIFILIA